MNTKNIYARVHRAADFLPTTRFQRYAIRNNKIIDFAFVESGLESALYSRFYFTGIAEANVFYPRYLNTREGERKGARVTLFCKMTRKESGIYLPVRSREAFIRHSGIRSNKHSPETDSRADSTGGSTR